MSEPTPRLSYASLVVQDVERSGEFYRSALGLPYGWTGTPAKFRRLLAGGADLGLSWPGVGEVLGTEPGGAFLTFDPGSVAAVPQAAKRMLAAGATLVREPHETPYGTVQAILLDPDGHVVRLDHGLS